MNKILKLWNKSSKLMHFICIVVLLIVIRFIYTYFLTKNENFENISYCNYYYMNKCGHCEKFNPEWELFVQSYKGNIKLNKFEMNNAGSDIDKYNINGFPTILFLDNKGNSKVYEGPRTSDGLNNFIYDNTN